MVSYTSQRSADAIHTPTQSIPERAAPRPDPACAVGRHAPPPAEAIGRGPGDGWRAGRAVCDDARGSLQAPASAGEGAPDLAHRRRPFPPLCAQRPAIARGGSLADGLPLILDTDARRAGSLCRIG